MGREIYFDFGKTIAAPTSDIKRMLVEILTGEEFLQEPIRTDVIEARTDGYLEKYGVKGLNEHRRPHLYAELTQDCENPDEIVKIIKEKEISYLAPTQANLKKVLQNLHETASKIGIIANSSYPHLQLGFLQHYELQEFPVLFLSSGEWVLEDEIYVQKETWTDVTKDDGSLYELLIKKGKISDSSLMVGDDPVTDGLMPRKAGLSAVIYYGGIPDKNEQYEIITQAEGYNLPTIAKLEDIREYLK